MLYSKTLLFIHLYIYNSLHLLNRIRFFYMFFFPPISCPFLINHCLFLSNVKHISHVYEYMWMSICTCLHWGGGKWCQERRTVIDVTTASKRWPLILILFTSKWNMVLNLINVNTPNLSPLPELEYFVLLHKIYSYSLSLSGLNSNIISSVKPFQLSQEEKKLNNHWREGVKLTKWKLNGTIAVLCWVLNICMNNVQK